MTQGEQAAYRMAAECRMSLAQALKLIRDRYARGELVVPVSKKRYEGR